MKKVLSDQESIERSIVNAKQAQKYLIEQSKLKEKNRPIQRPKVSGPTIVREDPDSINNISE